MAKRVREIRAVYDGKVFVPKEPVDLMAGQEVDITFLDSKVGNEPKKGSLDAIRRLAGIADCPSYDASKFSREDIYP
jgi:predicted DNA-binding antitoxin AbrB/MazE fold protein